MARFPVEHFDMNGHATTSVRLVLRVGVLVALVGGALAGCKGTSSGLIGGIHVLDDAVVVEDRFYAHSAVVHLGSGEQRGATRVTPAPGWLVPMAQSGPWVVFYDTTRTMRQVRKSRLNVETRLPMWVDDRSFRAIDVRTGAVHPFPNTLDNNDDGIVRLRVKGGTLVAEVAPRFHVGVTEVAPRYFAFVLPDGPWQPLSSGDGRAALQSRRVRFAFEDLRSAPPIGAVSGEPAHRPMAARARWAQANSFEQLSAAGLNSGDWGALRERKSGQRWETVYVSSSGAETLVLRENDWGFAEQQGSPMNRQPLP